MLNSFPRLILKENRQALSLTDVFLFFEVAKRERKLCLYGLYSFEKWRDGRPDPESVVLDCIALKGKKEILEKLAENYWKGKKESLLLFDGEEFLLITEHDGSPLEKINEPEGTILIRDIYFKFTYPGTPNGRTGKLSRIEKKWKK